MFCYRHGGMPDQEVVFGGMNLNLLLLKPYRFLLRAGASKV